MLHIIRNTIVLEGLSEETQSKAEEVGVVYLVPLSNNKLLQINSAKLGPTPYQQTVIDQLNKSTPAVEKKKRRKRPKGPNPLSVKKSNKLSVQVRKKGVETKSKVCVVISYTIVMLLTQLTEKEAKI